MVGYLAPTDLEHIETALFEQARHAVGLITPKDIEWFEEVYFYYLICGCVLHKLISNHQGEPGPLAEFIKSFIEHRQIIDPSYIEGEFMKIALETVEDILDVWIMAAYGNDILCNWAKANRKELSQERGKMAEMLNSTIRDAIRYCRLVQTWPSYVVAIENLTPRDALWLFRPVSPDPKPLEPKFGSLRVFLCHSSNDKPAVRNLYKKLFDEGIDAWLDEEKLLPGYKWDDDIKKAVQESDVVIICLSKSSITKEGYVQKEIRLALDKALEKPDGAIFIIPARLEDCDVPEKLKGWQWVNLFEESGYERLVKALEERAEDIKGKAAIIDGSSAI